MRVVINIPNDRGKLYEVIHYPAGEIQVRLTQDGLTEAKSANEYQIVANPIPDMIELAQLKDALDALPNKFYETVLNLPYLPFARADRRFVEGDSFGLRVFSNLINSLDFHVVTTFDAHSNVGKVEIPNLVNESAKDEIEKTIAHVEQYGGDKEEILLIAPDHGAGRRYNIHAFGKHWASAEKTRDAATGKLSGFKITDSVKFYKKALIIDDICDGGGTFLGLGKVIKEINPDIKLFLYVSHGIFSQGFQKLDEIFESIIISKNSFRGNYQSEFITEIK